MLGSLGSLSCRAVNVKALVVTVAVLVTSTRSLAKDFLLKGSKKLISQMQILKEKHSPGKKTQFRRSPVRIPELNFDLSDLSPSFVALHRVPKNVHVAFIPLVFLLLLQLESTAASFSRCYITQKTFKTLKVFVTNLIFLLF